VAQVTLDRLEDQIRWYDMRSAYCQKMYKSLKVIEVVAAAFVPLLAGLSARPWLTGALGAVVVVLEGVQQLNQYHDNWIAYRSTAEALKHEKYLHAAKAGPYAAVDDPDTLLAERVEGSISKEHAKWVSSQEQRKAAQQGSTPR
jgi:hypothetical protein